MARHPPRYGGGLRRVLAIAFAVHLLLYVGVSWPWILDPGATVPGIAHMDQLGHLWATWNARQSLANLHVSPFNFAPWGQNVLIVHGGNLDLVLGGLLARAGLPVAAAHGVVLAAWFVAAGLAGTGLGWWLTGRAVPALVGGLLLAWQPWVQRMAAQGLVEQAAVGFVAVALAGSLRCSAPGRTGPALLAVGVVTTTLAGWEYGVFLAFAMGVHGLLSVGEGREVARRRLLGCLAASVVLLPLVALFLHDMVAARTALAAALPQAAEDTVLAELRGHQSLSPDALFLAVGRGPTFSWTSGALAVVALASRAPGSIARRVLLAWFVTFVVLAFGPALRWAGSAVDPAVPLPFAALVQVFPFLRWLYWPERFVAIAAVGLAGLAALGAARLGRWAPLALLGIAGESLRTVDHAFPRLPVTPLPPPPAVYACLDQAPPGSLLVAPLPSFGIPTLLGRPQDPAALALNLARNEGAHQVRWWQVSHGRPLYAGVDVPHTVPAAWRAAAAAEPTVRMLALASAGVLPADGPPADAAASLHAAGVAAVVVHDAMFRDPAAVRAVVGWLRAALGEPTCRARAPPSVAWVVPAVR